MIVFHVWPDSKVSLVNHGSISCVIFYLAASLTLLIILTYLNFLFACLFVCLFVCFGLNYL